MNSDEEPIASVFRTPKTSNAQSIYYPIFQPFIDTSPTFSPVNVGTKMSCPIRNKIFFVTEIEEHAEVRLTRKTQQNIMDITNDSEAKGTTSYIDLNGNDTDKSDTIDTKSHFLSKIKSVLKSAIFTNGEAKLNIRRNFSCMDFCNYLNQILEQTQT